MKINKNKLAERSLDHATDIVGIGGITFAAYHGVASDAVVAGIVTISLGKKAGDVLFQRLTGSNGDK